MRIVCLSDIHGKHKKLKNVPDGDVLVFAGDILSGNRIIDLIEFNKWLGKWKHKHKIVVAGNHDWCFFREKSLSVEHLNNAVYLENSEVVIDGVKFYGSPYQPIFCDWAFNLPQEKLRDVWKLIPKDTNVLITHCPPRATLDLVDNINSDDHGEMVGCIELAKKVAKLKKLKLHIFGHIHCAYGKETKNGVQYVNACICTEEYKVGNEPIVIDI